MTQDEQAQIIGKKALRLKELTTELTCLKSKLEDFLKDVKSICGLFTGERSGKYNPSEDNFMFDDVSGLSGFTSPTNWPKPDQVARLLDDIKRVEAEIQQINSQYGDLLKIA